MRILIKIWFQILEIVLFLDYNAYVSSLFVLSQFGTSFDC